MSASARRSTLAASVRAPAGAVGAAPASTSAALATAIEVRWTVSRRALRASRPELVREPAGSNAMHANPELEWRLEGAGRGAACSLLLSSGERLSLLHADASDIEWIELGAGPSGDRHIEVRVRGGCDLVLVATLGSDVAVRYAVSPVLNSLLGLDGGHYEPPRGRWITLA